MDAPPVDDHVLDAALEGLPVLRADSLEQLTSHLRVHDVSVLVLPHGSAFPVDAWPEMRAFFAEGGGLAVLGGAPLHEPVAFQASTGTWARGPRQTVFAHQLLIGPAEPIATPATTGWKTVLTAPAAMAGFSLDDAAFPVGKTTWSLTLRLTNDKEFPDEHGSAGPRSSVARPLLHVLDPSGTPRGCPLLEIDRLEGPSRGARLVLATTDAKLEAPAIRQIVSRALQGASELRVVPESGASVSGPTKRVRLAITDGPRAASSKPRLRVTVSNDAGARQIEADTSAGIYELDASALAPGLYHVLVEDRDTKRAARTGFWVKDEKLLASGPKLTVGRDWLRRDGKPFPIVGTTYMASDAHRHFLFEPNPDAWDVDFAEMKKRGINFVRTGLWTAWSRAAPRGDVDPNVLSALEAFVQTAAKHDIVVCFNLFAFLPPSFGGTNAYLDRRSIAGQETMVKALAKRFANVSWIHWDLINEPSYAPLSKLWRTRPIGDESEKAAWRSWVAARHPNMSQGELRALWRVPEGDVLAVPRDDDFTMAAVQIDRRPRKARDFRELTEDAITQWAATLRGALREAGGPTTLVTLGQDEGGIFERATQQLMAPSLDYTAVHTWWKNDDLLWDGVVTKVIGKPSLHQETGLMRLEDLDGTPWRTPEEAARLLERKLGYAFAGRGAGVVEWVWNVNPYMPIDEESTIGLFRPDGTAKPELDVLVQYASFFGAHASRLDDFEPDDVVLVIPHARAFLGMTGAIDATKHVVRALAERYGVVPAAVSDLRLTAAALRGAKLVLVPCADVLDEGAAQALVAALATGTKVLVTGPIDGDSYGRLTPSLRALGVVGRTRPVAMHERSTWSTTGFVAFEGMLQETARRVADKASLTPAALASAAAAKQVWHEPLPLELARDREPLVKLLGAALAAAKVTTSPDDGAGGVAARVLLAPRVAMIVVVNERAEAARRKVFVDGRSIEVNVDAKRTSVLLVDRPSGVISARKDSP